VTYGSAPAARPAPAPGNAARPALLGSGRHLPAAGHGSVRLGVASYPEWVIGASPAAEELGPPGRGFGRGLITVRGPHFYRPLVSPVFLANRASFSGHPVLRPLQQQGPQPALPQTGDQQRPGFFGEALLEIGQHPLQGVPQGFEAVFSAVLPAQRPPQQGAVEVHAAGVAEGAGEELPGAAHEAGAFLAGAQFDVLQDISEASPEVLGA